MQFMESRPSWRAILFWLKRPLYVAIIFVVMIILIILVDRYLLLWQGSIAQRAGSEEFVTLLIFACILTPMFAWNILRWYTTTHNITDKQIIFSHGIFNKKRYVVNYENIQNINVERNFLERLLMITSIKIETAGSKPGEAEFELEGIDSKKAEKLVSEISLCVEAVKGKGKNSSLRGDIDLRDLMNYSQKILIELKEIKELLLEKKKRG